mgnify:CR=1 FL=1
MAGGVNSTEFLKTLGMGTGVDIKQLAQTLTDAQGEPKKDVINKSIAESNAKISAYSSLLFGLDSLDTAFKTLNDKGDFQSLTSKSSDSTKMTATTTTTASTGKHHIVVSQLAKAERLASAGYSSSTSTLNSGTAFNIALTAAGVTRTVQLGNVSQITQSGTYASNSTTLNGGASFDVVIGGNTVNVDGSTFATTPSGVVSAINSITGSTGVTATYSGNKIVLTGTAGSSFAFSDTASDLSFSSTQSASSGSSTTPAGIVSAINNLDWDVTASLIDTGASSNPFKVVLQGKTGTANDFSVSLSNKVGGGTPSGIAFTTSLQSAQNAQFTVDGLSVERGTNLVTDVLTGVNLELLQTTGGSEVTLDIMRNTSEVKKKVENLVSVFNNLTVVMDTLANHESGEELGGVLVGDSTLRTVKQRVVSLVTTASTTPGTTMTSLSDIGVTLDRYGKLTINQTTLSDALDNESHFLDIRKMFSADTDIQSEFSTSNAGIAGDAIKDLRALMATDGIIKSKSTGQTKDVARFEQDLKDLEKRLAGVYDRYITQFTAMETSVNTMNGIRDSLKQQFEYQSKN